MLHKGAIYWAAAFGVAAAVGAGGAIWHYRSAVPPAGAQTRLFDPPIAPPQDLAAASASPDPVAAVSPKQPEPSREADLSRPQFDIVRVEPTGEAVIAGHSAPKARVAVTDHGQVVAEADADETGQFVVLPPTFAPGSHTLGLTARTGDGAAVQSPGVVGIDVPQPSAKSATAAMAAPSATGVSTSLTKSSARTGVADPSPASTLASRALEASPSGKSLVQSNPAAPAPSKPTESILIAKTETPIPRAAASPRVVVTGVATDETGRMVATGAASAGAFLRLYLNGSFLADVTAGANGLWALTVEHGMKGGAYSIRADEINRTTDTVISRAEVPFNYSERVAELALGATPAPVVATPPAPAGTQAPAPEPRRTVAPAAAPAMVVKDVTVALSSDAALASPRQSAVGGEPSAPSGAAHAIVPLVDTAKVVPGDSLWAISAHLYGNGLRYTQIYAANAGQIRDPWLIYPGQIFVLPRPTPF
jgi:nucleoid-associated protein YgaU